jgi:hypothetical protein
MLETKVANLRAPPQKQRVERDHRGDVADADVGDVNASKTRREIVALIVID